MIPVEQTVTAMSEEFTSSPMDSIDLLPTKDGYDRWAAIYDAEASAVYRMGRYELSVGAKVFHFKTSPQNSQYFIATYPGVFVAFRYYPKWIWR